MFDSTVCVCVCVWNGFSSVVFSVLHSITFNGSANSICLHHTHAFNRANTHMHSTGSSLFFTLFMRLCAVQSIHPARSWRMSVKKTKSHWGNETPTKWERKNTHSHTKQSNTKTKTTKLQQQHATQIPLSSFSHTVRVSLNYAFDIS